MEMVDDETQDRTEETEAGADASDMNSDQNNVTILLNNSRNAQNSSTNTIQMVKTPKAADLAAAKRTMQKYSNRLQHPPSTEEDNSEIELEVDLIVVDDKKADQATESNENEESAKSYKRLRLEVEPLISLPNESSPNVETEEETEIPTGPKCNNQSQKSEPRQQPPPPPPQSQPQSQPRKSIEEIVSSSEVFDANSEDKYFALSILGTLRRLTPHKRALAKCHILSYLTEIEYGNSNSTT